MKILFFGRGAIGTQYAWAFENAGHTVEFYVREGRKNQNGSHVNLEIWDSRRSKKDQRVKEKWPILTHEEIKDDEGYDLIFLSVNPEQVSSAISFLAPRVGKATVLFFCHYWQDPQLAVSPIPLGQIVWALGGGGGFEGNTLYGVLNKTVPFLSFVPEASKRELEVHKLFIDAGFKIVVHKDAQSWLWNRFAMNVAMEIEVLKNGSFKSVITSRQSLAGVGRNMKEIIKVLRAKGSKIDLMTGTIGVLPAKVVGFMMGSVMSPKGMRYAAVEHNHFKVGYAVREVIADARRYGIKAPRLYAVEKLIAE